MPFRSLLLLLLITTSGFAQIRVHQDRRYLTTKEGKPFFWLADTDWELFHRLDRKQAEEFIETRSKQGFNILQAVALAEFNGIRQPNRYGDLPLVNEDPAKLLTTDGNDPADPAQYDYWDHVDFIIQKAASKNMYIGLLPTWGDKVTLMWGEGPVVFNEQHARIYGASLAKRYRNQWNIIWILGGDRPGVYKRDGKDVDDRPIWRAMAAGIREVMGNEVFITYHTSGGEFRTTDFLVQEDWLSMHSFQSGHGSRESEAWRWVSEDLRKDPSRPTLDMEPCYEDHPVNPWDGKWTRKDRGYFDDYDVRARIYRGVFAGACGVTYGHHQVWQFLDTSLYPPVNIGDTIIGWKKAALSAGARQMIHLKNLMLSRPYFGRIEDTMIVHSGWGKDYRDRIIATRDSAATYAMIYLPQNKAVSVDLSTIQGLSKNIFWYDVRTGRSVKTATLKINGLHTFEPPKNGKDWVLVIDDSSKKYPRPGIPLK